MAITKIFSLFAEDRIVFLSSGEKEAIITELSRVSAGKVTDVKAFTDSVIERENIVSTGVGQGFAIPHVKNNYVPEFFITAGIIRSGADWDAIDGQPVNVVFLIGGPDGKQNEYLSILSKLSLIIKNPSSMEQLLASAEPGDVLRFFSRF